MTSDGTDRKLSFFTWQAAAFIFLGAAIVLWPLLLTGGHPFMMIDSAVYADQGERIWSVIADMLAAPPETSGAAETTATPSAVPDAGQAGGIAQSLRAASQGDDTVRSIPYAAFVGLLLPLGTSVVLYVQAVLVMTALYAVVAPFLQRLPIGVSFAICGLALVASALPTMASYLMPDIFGAVIILFSVGIATGLHNLDAASRTVFVAIAVAALTFHYGNIPMAILLFGLAALLRTNRRKAAISLALIAGGTAGIAIVLNVAIGVLGFGSASVAPARAPILLARSIEDGPARWILEEDCASDAPQWALCEFWGTDIPSNVGAALWNEGGMNNAPAELYTRIRAEEFPLLISAVRTYPLQQVFAFVENAYDQFRSVGVGYARPAVFVERPNGRRAVSGVEATAFESIRPHLAFAHGAGYLAGLAGLAAMVFLSPVGGVRRAALLILAGFCVNAAIFGGLSAPVDRYQARVAWLAIAIAALFWADTYRSESPRRPPD